MIKSIVARNLKGMTFSRDIGQRTLVIGPNGSGKTAVRIAACLAVNGHLPGIKTNPDIHSAFASMDALAVGVALDGTTVHRQWKRSPKGNVSQTFMVDRRKSTKEQYVEAIMLNGNPKIFDVSLFMDLSAKKKAEYLFSLYPPAGDVAKIEKNIEANKSDINKKQSKLASNKDFIAKTMAARNEMDLPAGTLAEVKAEIGDLTTQIEEVRQSIRNAEHEAEEARKKEAEAEDYGDVVDEFDPYFQRSIDEQEAIKAEADKGREKDFGNIGAPKEEDFFPGPEKADVWLEESGPIDPDAFQKLDPDYKVTPGGSVAGDPFKTLSMTKPEPKAEMTQAQGVALEAEKLLKEIVEAIESANCPVCAEFGFALATAKRGLKHWQAYKEKVR